MARADALGVLSHSWFSSIAEIIRYSELLRNLVARDLKVRYRRSVLGLLWTLLNPLLMMVIFTIVFSGVFRSSLQRFPVYFLAAFLAWMFFAQTTVQALTTMLRSAPLYKRIYVPKAVFVLANVVSGLVNLLLALIPLAVLLLLLRHPLRPALLFLPVPILLLALFTTGVSLTVATLSVFFDDINHFYQVALQALMYLSAIFYPVDIVPDEYRLAIYLNPLYYLIETVRTPVYRGILPDPYYLLISAVCAFLAFIFGWWIFHRSCDRFIYYV